MASRKPQPGLAEAAEKTCDLIRGLQSRLQAEAVRVVRGPDETEEDLERQLIEYFERVHSSSTLNEIRNRVIDGVVEKILSRWEQPQRGAPASLQDEVVERLIERVLTALR